MQLHTLKNYRHSVISVRRLTEDEYHDMINWVKENLKESTLITYRDEFYIHIRFGSDKDFNWFYLKYG